MYTNLLQVIKFLQKVALPTSNTFTLICHNVNKMNIFHNPIKLFGGGILRVLLPYALFYHNIIYIMVY